MKSQLRQLYYRGRSAIVKKFLSYDSDGLFAALQALGIKSGDILMVHSALNTDNGFVGNAKSIISVFKDIVTEEGLLVMPSMPYADSSRAFLQRGKPMHVRRSPSHMGLISEVFRRNKEVKRSLNPIHPLLAWGKDAEAFLADHEKTLYSFGGGSPFEKLLEQNAKVLCFDVGFEFITFTHFVEDQLKDQFSFPLYDEEPITGAVIDENENEFSTDSYVLSDISRDLRREERLVAQMEKNKQLKKSRIGNTKLLVVDCKEILSTASHMLTTGEHFFDSP